MPRVTKSWYVEMMTPRIRAGELSDWYMGTATERAPLTATTTL